MSEYLLKLKCEQSKYRSRSFRIHRGRLDNVYLNFDYMQKKINFIFKSFEKFRKIFSFSRFRKSKKSKKHRFFEIWKMKIFFRLKSMFFQISKKIDVFSIFSIFELWKMKNIFRNFSNLLKIKFDIFFLHIVEN